MTPIEPATAAPKKLMTVDEYWEFSQRPENADRRTELIHGEVIEMSRPTRPHGRIVTNIGFVLETYARSRGVGYVVTESGVVLDESPGTVVGPDLAYYTDADSFEDIPPKWGEVLPVLAVEVLSPNDKMSKVNDKIAGYLRNGVKLVWLADYEERVATVYRPGRSHELVRGDCELLGGDDLPGFTCKVSEFFRHPADKPASVPSQPPTT